MDEATYPTTFDILDTLTRLCFTTYFITLFWPINAPLMGLAYKIRLGPESIPLEWNSFLLRSVFASLLVAVLAVILLFLTMVLHILELPVEIGVLGGLALFLPVGTWVCFWLYALDEMLDGFTVLAIYLLLPLPVVLLIMWLFKLSFYSWWMNLLSQL
ncbi:MAG: hypothetical protein ACK4RK_05010 [Gemmataceae bacterium]